jgi:acetyl coenzyme A synthetase (ADP forming)-like protein
LTSPARNVGPGAPPGYPRAWEADVVLSDGTVLHLRPVVPEDADRFRALNSRVSEETLYFRFFTPRRDLSDAELARFASIDYDRRMAFAGERSGLVVAVGRYERLDDGDTAEVAFIVEDRLQGRGVGTLLLEHLAAYAREHGIRRFVADTLGENRRMLTVFDRAGYAVERRFDGGTWHVEFPIEPAPVTTIESREHLAEARSIHRLLAPASVAVVGAGRDPSSIGHAVVANMKAAGFAGPIYPVNPKGAEVVVAGLPCFPSVESIPETPDLAVVAVPAAAVLDVVDECGRRGVGGLVILSAGFAETGAEGRAAQDAIRRHAHDGGMRLIGPNCMGVVNTAPGVRLNATFAPVWPPAGRVGFLSQSGALGIALLEDARRLGVGISTFVSVGNKADVSGNDMLQYWRDDPDTDVVLLYLESFGNPRKFGRIAPRLAREKPVVAVKSGRSTSGRRAAASHTAALATPDVAVDALFHQAGVVRVDTIEEMFDVARVFANQPLPEGRRVAIVGNSGGPGILAADACENAGLEVPRLAPETSARLSDLALPGAAVSNPVDLLAAAAPEQYGEAVTAVLADTNVDAVLVIYTNPLVTNADDIAAAVADAARGASKPVVANFLATTGIGPVLATGEDTGGVPVFPYPENPVRALAHAARLAEWRRRPVGSAAAPPAIDERAGRAVIDAAFEASGAGWLSPDDTRALLAAGGIGMVPLDVVATPGEAVDVASRVGYPIAVKAVGHEVVHKTDVGGVALDLRSADEVARAVFDMQESLGNRVEAFGVQRMIAGGVETIVGLVNDPTFGPLVMFGTGGTATEVFGDREFRLTPLTDVDAAELVRSVRASRLLFGHRGRPAADLAALELLLRRVAWLGSTYPDIAEIDLNPAIALPDGVAIVDARVRIEPAPTLEPAVRRLND